MPFFEKSRIDRYFDGMIRMIQDAVVQRKRDGCTKCDVFRMLMEEFPNTDVKYNIFIFI